jgi:hypothetical protein
MKYSSLDLVINYILQHELEDYIENPSEDHIYFHVIAAKYGIDEAKKELSEALKNLENR